MKPTRFFFLPTAAFILLSTLLPRAAQATIRYVVETAADCGTLSPCYTSIQDALTAADPTTADQVLVKPGTYVGQIQLRKDITVKGEEAARTFLSGGGSGPTVKADLDPVTADIVTGAVIQNFTFINATVGVSILNSTSSATLPAVTIQNNIFQLGTAGTAVDVQTNVSTTTKILNNTFYLNGTAISLSSNVEITNNIFSGNQTTAISSTVALTAISYNCYHNNTANGVTLDSASIPNTNFPDPDPKFVNADQGDFHLQQDSPGIDQGSNGISDPAFYPTARSDMGAYGGPQTDTIPFKVSGLFGTGSSTAYSLALTWTRNTCYLVKGYNIYYDYNTTPTATSKKVNADAVASFPYSLTPDTTGFVITPPLSTDIPAPANLKAVGQYFKLKLSWSSVTIPSPPADADDVVAGYKLHYGVSPSTGTVLDVGNVTAFDLTPLMNDTTYSVAVSAYWQAPFHVSVKASYDATHESSQFSNEAKIPAGPQTDGTVSAAVEGTPEALISNPNLPNSGCFIATAAFGHYSTPEVQALRDFRDRYLLKTSAGKAFVRWYYSWSPEAAQFINEHAWLKPVVRAALLPAVAGAAFMTKSSGSHTRTAGLIFMLTCIVFLVYRKKLLRQRGVK